MTIGKRGTSPARTLRTRPAVLGFAVLGLLLLAADQPALGPASLNDPELAGLRKAAESWNRRIGPERQVVDVVCLVPDVPTFFEAIASWDQAHYFPILIDDAYYTLKFLRAFRPARVVRFPKRGEKLDVEDTWSRALNAAGLAWVANDLPLREQPRGDVIPTSLGTVPPAVVVTHPQSPSLAGAVALAAGRFQPLMLWETPKGYGDTLTTEEALQHTGVLEASIASLFPRYWELADDCDFITLAGNYPYRYYDVGHRNSLDDLMGRSLVRKSRWAYAGRLMGDSVASVYRAMCSLFLPARSGLLFNGYDEVSPPWNEYLMNLPAATLNPLFPTAHRSGERGSLDGWHQAFDPVNRYDFVYINSSGGPNNFNLRHGPLGHTADIPETDPVAVVCNHSFSAETPENPQTLAGRWLANGAFLYYGSMNEPYLQSFRRPSLVASCLAANLPLSAAVRRLPFEIFGQPWRLHYIGDPLYRLRPLGQSPKRLATWAPLDGWSIYGEYKAPEPTEPDAVRLNWALKSAIHRLQAGAKGPSLQDLAGTLLGIDRARLDANVRPIFDGLLADILLQSGRSGELLDRLRRIPDEERTDEIRRMIETIQTSALSRASLGKDFRLALALWTEVIATKGSPDYVKMFTDRVGQLADSPVKQADWLNRLRNARQSTPEEANKTVIDEELKKVEEKLRKG